MPDLSALAERLRGILAAAQPSPFAAPSTPRGWLELAYERAYAEDHAGAARAARAGLDLVAGDPALEPETALALWGVAASVRQLDGDEDGARECAARRVELLRAMGRTAQADIEEQLGPLLYREPRPEEAAVLEAAVATHAAAGTDAGVLADARLPLAVARFEAGDESALGDLIACADAYADAGRTESEAGALLYAAHAYTKAGNYRDSLAAAERLLELDVNRAMRASVWMVKATAHTAVDEPIEAEGCAVRALELYAAAGVRRGAVSAAALVANLASAGLDQEAAVLAWRIAVDQAERGEFDETWAVRLALGNQLLEAGEHLLAEEVLERLAAHLEGAGRPADRARTLVALGHCYRHQDRPEQARRVWDEATATFIAEDLPGEAARTLLAAGTLEAQRASRRDGGGPGPGADPRDPDPGADTRDAGPGGAEGGPGQDGGAPAGAAEPAAPPGGVAGAGPGGGQRPGDGGAATGRTPSHTEYFERAVALARAAAETDPGALPQALHALGHALCEGGDADGLGLLDEAIRLADDHGADWHAADFRDTRARGLWSLGHGPEAVAAALEAADLFHEADDPDAGGNAELFAAHVLADLRRDDEAARLFRLIATEHSDSIAHFYAAQRGLAGVLTRMGLPAQAKEASDAAERALREAGAPPADPTLPPGPWDSPGGA